MGQYTTRKAAFVSTLAAAAMALMLAASDSFAIEATEIGPGPAGQGVSPAVAGKGEGPWAKAGSTLRRIFAAHSAHQQAGADTPFKPDNPSVQFAQGLILIDAVASSDGAALLEELRALGLKGGTQYGAVVSGRIPLGLLGQVVGLESLRSVSASLKPETNSAVDPTFGLVHDRSAAIAMNLIATDADPQTYTGAGIKVGILSDTFNNNGNPDYDGNGVGEPPATNADDDLVNGDLPGGGPYVALHTPGDVDDDDKSTFGAIGTTGSTAAAADTNKLNNLAGNFYFTPVNGPDENPSNSVISWPDASQFAIGLKPFTIEMWVNFDAIFTSGSGKGPILASQYTASGDQRSWLITALESTAAVQGLQFIGYDGVSEFPRVSVPVSEFTPVINNWYHIAVSRDDVNDLRIFVNGISLASVNFPYELFNSNAPIRLGMFDLSAGNNRHLEGSIEDFRFVVGEALYTANFTPSGPLASELPGAGPTASTTIVDDTANPGIDEGRAMAQLIHDVAPDASVSFHTAFNGMADFAQGIQDLANDGADVIVDDIIYFAEPMFQDGIVAQAVDNVVAQGKAYFSSAGNSAQHSYESAFVASGERLTVGPEERGMLHDFDPGGGVDYMQSVTIPFGTTFTLVAQWDQPFASNCPDPQPPQGCPGSENDVDIYLVNNQLQILTSSISDNLDTGEPVEILQLQNLSQSYGTNFHIMMTHYDVKTPQHPKPGSPPELMKYVWFGQSEITVNEHTTDSASSYGHANSVGAEAVGAAFYLDSPAYGTTPPVRESYSSRGGVPILFDVSGNALGGPDVREKPEIVAPDGTNTTFFFRDTSLDDADEAPETFPNFFGTSAAAPHAAAIAALMLEANPTLTPGDIYSILESTAVDMSTAGFDFDTGYGLINATAAIAQATGGNLVPVANDDNAATDQNTLVAIPVLVNDAPGDPATVVTIESVAAAGTAIPNGNGTDIDYTPDLDFFGPDSFQYRITDDDGEFSIATVNVTVNEIDIQPLAANDNTATDEDVTANNIDVMANDDPLGNAPTTITAAGPGEPGSIVSTDGSTITYTPAANFFGSDIFPYTITDGDGDSSNANLTVSVNPVNDDPVAGNDATSTNEDNSVGFDDALMLAGDSDIENDPLSIIVVDLKSSQLGDVTNHGNGTYTYMPPPNFNGSDAIDYTVSDGNGGSATASVVVTVNAINDAPDAATILNQNNQDDDVGISVDASTTDIENGTLSYLIAGQPAGLSINSATGEITGTIDANASVGGAGGVYTVTVTASDASLSTDYQFSWTISAGPVNGSPNPGNVPSQNSVDGQSGISVSAATTDPESDTISYSLSGQPAGLTINSSTGLITGSIANDASLGSVYTVTVTADDTFSTPTQYQFNWTVNDPAPVAVTVGSQNSVDGQTGISVNAATTDPDGDTLSYSVSGQPAGLSINGASGVISGTIANNASLTSPYTVTVTANDGTTPTNYQFSWTVTAPPAIVHVGGLSGSSAPAPRGRWDASVVITVHNAVDGVVAGATVNGTWSNGTNGGASCLTNGSGQCSVEKLNLKGNVASVDFTVGSITGAGTYEPGANHDPLGSTVTVFQNGPPADLLPNAVDDSEIVIEDAVNVPIAVLDNDSLGDAPTSITDVTDPPNGTAAIVGSLIEYTPDPGHIGADSFNYTITDVDGDTSSATVSIDVVPDTGPTDVHIGSLSGSSASAPKKRWNATVTITVHNSETPHGPVSGATVNGTWSSGATGGGSCITDGAGQCSVAKNNLKGNVGSVAFTVDTVTGANMNYISGANHGPGSAITVVQ